MCKHLRSVLTGPCLYETKRNTCGNNDKTCKGDAERMRVHVFTFTSFWHRFEDKSFRTEAGVGAGGVSAEAIVAEQAVHQTLIDVWRERRSYHQHLLQQFRKSSRKMSIPVISNCMDANHCHCQLQLTDNKQQCGCYCDHELILDWTVLLFWNLSGTAVQ